VGDPLRPPPLAVEDLTVAYDRQPAVHHLSGRFEPGSLTAIVGPNGAGKSTLLKALVGLLPASQGRVIRPADRAALAYLPQQVEIDRSFPITVADAVSLGLWRDIGAFGAIGAAGRARVTAALAAVGLAERARQGIGALSAGQLQRALFARLLLQDAPVILLDEPFAAIDEATTRDLLALLSGWHEEGRTVVAVLHELDEVRAHFPQTLLLAREPVAWGPTPEVLTEARLQRARQLAGAWRDGGAR
jgi:zinc/manganese transport system ATP-binding protein